jgi:predicted RecB family endonuclease
MPRVMPLAPVIPLNNFWMDLPVAAEHVEVHFADLVAAVARGEMFSVDDHHGRPGISRVRMLEVEDWAVRRAGLAG